MLKDIAGENSMLHFCVFHYSGKKKLIVCLQKQHCFLRNLPDIVNHNENAVTFVIGSVTRVETTITATCMINAQSVFKRCISHWFLSPALVEN